MSKKQNEVPHLEPWEEWNLLTLHYREDIERMEQSKELFQIGDPLKEAARYLALKRYKELKFIRDSLSATIRAQIKEMEK